MKIIISCITITALFCICQSPTALGQEATEDAVRRVYEADRRLQEESRRQAEVAQDLELRAGKLQDEAAGGMQLNSGAPVFKDRLHAVIQRAPAHPDGKSLLVRWSDLDPKEQASLEEDLAVMSH